MAEENLQTCRFIESHLQRDLHVDREHNVVKDVKIVGLQSRNTGDRANDYPAPTLAAAVKLYEGMTVYTAHSKDEKGNWQYSDANGNVRNIHPGPDGSLFGDHHYNPKHHLTEQYLWDAENNPGNVAFSHEASGKRRYDSRRKRYVVEEIKQVNGICMVPRGGTNSSLFEQEETVTMADTSTQTTTPDTTVILREALAGMTVEQLRTLAPAALIEKLTGTDAATKLATENATLKEQLAALQARDTAAQKATAITAELAAAKLTEADLGKDNAKLLLSPVFIEQLNAAPDAPARAKLIEFVKALVPKQTAPATKTWSQAVTAPAATTPDNTTFTEAKTVDQTVAALRA